MEKILCINQIEKDFKDADLVEDKLVVLFEEDGQQNVLVVNFSSFQYFEYPIINLRASKVTCDKNLSNLLLFEENLQENQTIIYQVNLERSISPIRKSVIPQVGITGISWYNMENCLILMNNKFYMYDLIRKSFKCHEIINLQKTIDIQIDPQNQFIIQCSQSGDGTNDCTLFQKDNQEEKMIFKSSVYDFINQNQNDYLLLLSQEIERKTIFLTKITFDDGEFHQALGNASRQIVIEDLQNIKQMKIRSQMKEILLLDQTNQLFIIGIDEKFNMIFKEKFHDVNKFGFTTLQQNLILLKQNNEIFVNTSQMDFRHNNQQLEQQLSIESKTNKKNLHGLIETTKMSTQDSNEEKIQKQCQDEFQRFESKFDCVFQLEPQFNQISQREYRVIIFHIEDDSEEKRKLIPKMKYYYETDFVKQHMNDFNLFGDDQPIIYEGGAASGKTSFVQYLAQIKNQPLIIMNLNSNTQIDDFIGKVEIQPEFKFVFKLGSFAEAVQKGYWILFDEANLAPEPIIKVIEDVLELGYLTIYGKEINSNSQSVDGTFTIRKHQNFRLFMTYNPKKTESGSEKFSDQFISLFQIAKFVPITTDCIHQIIQQYMNVHQVDKKEELLVLVMEIYTLIKENEPEGGFTIRDIIQLLDLLMLENNHKNAVGNDILPMMFCIELVLTQFRSANTQEKVKNKVKEFEKLGYSNKDFELQLEKYTEVIIQWSFSQECVYLSCYTFIFKFLTLCYLTKRAALIVSMCYCGKLQSVMLWLQLQNIKNLEIVELSASTTQEDLFGRYQPVENGFEYFEGPVVKCFKNGGVLILKNIEAADNSLTESLNGLLDKTCQSLTVNNTKHEKHENFFIIAITSDYSQFIMSTTQAFKSRFLTFFLNYEISIDDVYNLFTHSNLKLNETMIDKIFKSYKSILKDNQILVDLKNIIRLLIPLRQFLDFYTKFYNKTKVEAYNKIEENIDFFLKLSLNQESKSLELENFKEIPLKFKDLFANDYQKVEFIFTQSREQISNIIATAVACKYGLILQGTAGVGKTKIISLFQKECNYFKGTNYYYININNLTEIEDLMGSYISSHKKKNCFEFKKGPLYEGMEQGGIVLVDELNLNNYLMNFLGTVIKYPKQFYDPVSNTTIKVHEKFRLFFAQNPPTFEGRKPLTEQLACKTVIIDVPNYTFEETLSISTIGSKYFNEGIKYYLKDIIQYPEDGDVQKLKKFDLQFTLRQFLKFQKRLEKTNFDEKYHGFKDVIRLHHAILYDFNLESTLRADITKQENFWVFQIKSLKSNEQISCRLQATDDDSPYEMLQCLSENAKLTLCRLAMAFHCKENVVIRGKTSYKSFLIRLFSQMIKFQSKKALDILYVSDMTEFGQLIGEVESHNKDSYLKYCRSILRRLTQDEIADQEVINKIKQLKELQNFQSHRDFLENLLKNLETQFPFVERCITLAARFGGIMYLKDIDQAEQSVIEGLNSLLELEPQFYVNGSKLELHSELFIATSVNTNQNSNKPISDALQSRLTSIFIPQNNLLDNTKKIASHLKSYVEAIQKNKETSKEALLFMEQVFQEFFNKYRIYYHKLDSRIFYLWANTLNQYKPKILQISNLYNFYLSAQCLLMDPQSIETSHFKNDYISDRFNEAQKYLIDLMAKEFKNNNKMVFNKQTQSIIQKIFVAFQIQSIPCLIGPPGVGKSAVAKEIANYLNLDFCRICCSANLSVEDLFGSYAPKCSDQGETEFIFQEGCLAQALKKKSIILFDEINLASQEVLSTLKQLFNYDEKFIEVKDFVIDKQGNFFLCCMNPSTYLGRSELPICIKNFLTDLYIDKFEIDDTINIFVKSYENQIEKLKNQGIDFDLIIKLHKELAQAQELSESPYDFNIRFLQNLLSLFNEAFLKQREAIDEKLKQEMIIVCLQIIYQDHFANYLNNQKQKQFIENLILSKFQIEPQEWKKRKVFLTTFYSQVMLYRCIEKNDVQYLAVQKIGRFSPQFCLNNYVITYENSKIFEKLLFALQSKKIILCLGNSATGKTSTILQLASLLNKRAIFLKIHSQVEIDDLLGSFSMINETDEIFKLTKAQLVSQKEHKTAKQQKNIMKFVDGVLSICMREGYWLILDNVNQAPSQIIERLNSLGEDQPEFYLNEFGSQNGKLIPNENFRIICTQTLFQNVQISPAFYNRCLKISFELNLDQNSNDILEMLNRKSETQGFCSEENITQSKKLIQQILYLEKQNNGNTSYRKIQRVFNMIQDNTDINTEKILQKVYKETYQVCSQKTDFPHLNFKKQIAKDIVLKRSIQDTLSYEFFKIDLKNQKIETMKQFLFQFQKLKNNFANRFNYFFDQCEEIKLVTYEYNSLVQNRSYKLGLDGSFKINQFNLIFEIFPREAEIQIKNQSISKFYMMVDLQFQQFKQLANVTYEEKVGFKLQFNVADQQMKQKDIFPPLNEEIQYLFSLFEIISEIQGILLIQDEFNLTYNLKFLNHRLAIFGLDSLLFSDVSIQAQFCKQNKSFSLNTKVSYNALKIIEIQNLTTLSGAIVVQIQEIKKLLGLDNNGIQCFLKELNLKSEKSEIDLTSKVIEISLVAEENFQICSEFKIRLNKLQIIINREKKLYFKLDCTFLMYEKQFCELKFERDSKNQNTLKFCLTDCGNSNLKESIFHIFSDNFTDNIFLDSENQTIVPQINSGKLEISPQQISFCYELDFKLQIQILKLVFLDIKEMIVSFLKEQGKQIIKIEYKAAILSIQCQLTFQIEQGQSMNKCQLLRMNIKQQQQEIKFNELIHLWSPEVDQILAKLQDYKQIQITQSSNSEQYLEWQQKQLRFIIEMTFTNNIWRINNFLTLKNSSLKIDGHSQALNFFIQGQIEICNVELSDFTLNLNPPEPENKKLIIAHSKQNINLKIDPLDFSLKLLNKTYKEDFKELQLFPYFDILTKLSYDINESLFFAEFQISNTSTSNFLLKSLNFSDSIYLVRSPKTKMPSDQNHSLEVEFSFQIKLGKYNMNLKQDFNNIKIEGKQLESKYQLQKFEFAQFLRDSLNIDLPFYCNSIQFGKVILIIKFDLQKKSYTLQFDLTDGKWNHKEYFKLENLSGLIIFGSESQLQTCSINGKMMFCDKYFGHNEIQINFLNYNASDHEIEIQEKDVDFGIFFKPIQRIKFDISLISTKTSLQFQYYGLTLKSVKEYRKYKNQPAQNIQINEATVVFEACIYDQNPEISQKINLVVQFQKLITKEFYFPNVTQDSKFSEQFTSEVEFQKIQEWLEIKLPNQQNNCKLKIHFEICWQFLNQYKVEKYGFELDQNISRNLQSSFNFELINCESNLLNKTFQLQGECSLYQKYFFNYQWNCDNSELIINPLNKNISNNLQDFIKLISKQNRKELFPSIKQFEFQENNQNKIEQKNLNLQILLENCCYFQFIMSFVNQQKLFLINNYEESICEYLSLLNHTICQDRKMDIIVCFQPKSKIDNDYLNQQPRQLKDKMCKLKSSYSPGQFESLGDFIVFTFKSGQFEKKFQNFLGLMDVQDAIFFLDLTNFTLFSTSISQQRNWNITYEKFQYQYNIKQIFQFQGQLKDKEYNLYLNIDLTIQNPSVNFKGNLKISENDLYVKFKFEYKNAFDLKGMNLTGDLDYQPMKDIEQTIEVKIDQILAELRFMGLIPISLSIKFEIEKIQNIFRQFHLLQYISESYFEKGETETETKNISLYICRDPRESREISKTIQLKFLLFELNKDLCKNTSLFGLISLDYKVQEEKEFFLQKTYAFQIKQNEITQLQFNFKILHEVSNNDWKIIGKLTYNNQIYNLDMTICQPFCVLTSKSINQELILNTNNFKDEIGCSLEIKAEENFYLQLTLDGSKFITENKEILNSNWVNLGLFKINVCKIQLKIWNDQIDWSLTLVCQLLGMEFKANYNSDENLILYFIKKISDKIKKFLGFFKVNQNYLQNDEDIQKILSEKKELIEQYFPKQIEQDSNHQSSCHSQTFDDNDVEKNLDQNNNNLESQNKKKENKNSQQKQEPTANEQDSNEAEQKNNSFKKGNNNQKRSDQSNHSDENISQAQETKQEASKKIPDDRDHSHDFGAQNQTTQPENIKKQETQTQRQSDEQPQNINDSNNNQLPQSCQQDQNIQNLNSNKKEEIVDQQNKKDKPNQELIQEIGNVDKIKDCVSNIDNQEQKIPCQDVKQNNQSEQSKNSEKSIKEQQNVPHSNQIEQNQNNKDNQEDQLIKNDSQIGKLCIDDNKQQWININYQDQQQNISSQNIVFQQEKIDYRNCCSIQKLHNSEKSSSEISLYYPVMSTHLQEIQNKQSQSRHNQKTIAQKQEQQEYTLQSDYQVLNNKISQILHEQFEEQIENSNFIKPKFIRIIIILIKQIEIEKEQIIRLSQLLIGLQFLKIRYEVVLSGNFIPLLIKDAEENLSFHVLDRILHSLHQTQYQKFLEAKTLQLGQEIILFNLMDKIFNISSSCAEDLKRNGIRKVYFYSEKIHQFNIETDTSEIVDSCSIFKLLEDMAENLFPTVNEIKPIDQIDEQLIQKQSDQSRKVIQQELISKNGSRHILSKKGFRIDMKGIIKFIASNGSDNRIMAKREQSHHYLNAYFLVFDLQNEFRGELNDLLVLLFVIIQYCIEFQLICNLIVCCGTHRVHKFLNIKNEKEKEAIQNFFTSKLDWIESSESALEIMLDQLSQLQGNKISLIIINHSLFQYPKHIIQKLVSKNSLQTLILDAQGKFMFTQGFKNVLHLNLQIEGLLKKQSKQELNQTLNAILTFQKQEDGQQQSKEQFIFKLNKEQYSNQLEIIDLDKKQGEINNFEEYFNQYFNFIVKDQKQDQTQQLIKQGTADVRIDLFDILNMQLSDLNRLLQMLETVKKEKEQQINK